MMPWHNKFWANWFKISEDMGQTVVDDNLNPMTCDLSLIYKDMVIKYLTQPNNISPNPTIRHVTYRIMVGWGLTLTNML